MAIELDINRQSLPMTASTRIVLLGLGLGFLADRLFGTVGPFGLGFFCWSVLFAIVLLWLSRTPGGGPVRPVLIWALVAVSAAALMLVRTVPIIVLGLLLVMAVAMSMIMFHLAGRPFLESRLTEQLQALITMPVQGGLGAIGILGKIDVGAGLQHPGLWSGLRGALLAFPLMVVFVILFSSADASFDLLVEEVFSVFSAETVRHFVLTLMFAWLIIGLLATVIDSHRFAARSPHTLLKLGAVDTAVFMGSLAALFLLFVFLQLGYLFGGRETIEATSGLTLAQYARRGFFELLTVAGLTLTLLIAVAGSGCDRRVFRPLATVLIACVLIMQVSALQRLLLYIDQFGLTIDRVTALAVMVWVVGGILLFTATLLRGRTRLFAAGMTMSGVLVVLVLAAGNPGALVARLNIDRVADQQSNLDIGHLVRLGSDAVPVLVSNLHKLDVPQRCEAVVYLYSSWYANGGTTLYSVNDWRGWTASRQRAARLIADYEDTLKELATPCLAGSLLLDFLGRPAYEISVDHRIVPATEVYRWVNSHKENSD